MASPKFTVIIPAYNAGKYLDECMESLVSQSFKDFEVIVVDDGSTDRTAVLGRKYTELDNRFRLVEKDNGGVSSARNSGIDNAKGEWVLFVDADDVLVNTALEVLNSSINSTSSAGMYIWGWEEFSKTGIISKKLYSCLSGTVATMDIRKRLFTGDPYMGYVWNKLFRRDLIYDLRFDVNIKYNEDRLFIFEYLTRIEENIKYCKYIDQVLYRYRIHGNSVMSQFNKSVSLNLLTDLEAFCRMTEIADDRCEKNLVRTIVRAAWGNIRGMRKHLGESDDSVVARFEKLSNLLLSQVPAYIRLIWLGRVAVGKLLRLIVKRKK